MSDAERTENAPPRDEVAPPVTARQTVVRTVVPGTLLAVASGNVTLLSVNALSRSGDVTEGSALLVGFAVLHIALVLWLYAGFFRDVLAIDPARRAEPVDLATLERGFERVVNAPRFWALRSFGWFVLVGFELQVYRHWSAPEMFPVGQLAIRMVGNLAGAFVYAALLFFLLKAFFRPLLDSLARELPDLDAARERIQPLPLRAKLLVGVTGALLVSMLYGVTLAHVRGVRTAEAAATQLGARVLDGVAEDAAALAAFEPVAEAVEENADAEVAEEPAPFRSEEQVTRDVAKRLGLVDRIVFVDPAGNAGFSALDGLLLPFEVEWLRQTGLERGDSRGLDSPNHFAWRALADGRLALAISRAETYGAFVPGWSGAVGFFLAFVLLATLAIAWMLASDMERAVGKLGAETARLASGDLRAGDPVLREDELGQLASGLEHMGRSLGAMIVGVRGTADRVDSAAGEIAAASADLLTTSEEQRTGADTLRTSLLGVTGQVEGIAATAQQLTSAVDDGSRSILEMRGSGQHLDESANLLNEKVEEVSSAIDELIRSVRDVLDNAEHLSGAAVDTSSSMEEMAASLREVDANAVETARLSQGVVEQAEGGRSKVRETVKGMEEIRETTETARSVINDLGRRTHEIGEIVNVIDDVAEETNLLALNAAIIAAQAGENGRSFSVVADEIKKLADRVLTSTKEIEGVIRSVQNEAANAVGAIERGSRAVEGGVRQAVDAGEALDAITDAARSSGSRIGEIVTAVNEQTRAAGHVVSLMERVRAGVDQIRRAGQEQDRGNEAVLATSEVMREIAAKVKSVAGEQAQGSGSIADGVDAVREAVQLISAALSEQSVACGAAEGEVRELEARTQAHGGLAEAMEVAVGGMRGEAERLREAVDRFRV